MNSASREIANTLSLRTPQRGSLDALAHILDSIGFKDFIGGTRDAEHALEIIKKDFPILGFDREFVSLCFALATGVGKTRLMGACVAYLHRVYGVNNFFVLAPNLTIEHKLKHDFSPDSSKYVLRGIPEFSQAPPILIDAENYAQTDWGSSLFSSVRINVFNISKINSEVRGGKEPKIKRFQEVLGEGYFGYLANLPDLVLLMDESHRYRASAGVRAINELRPALGLEFTATPLTETSKGIEKFNNVIFDYPLAKAMADGFVKEPAVVTRRDFNASLLQPDEIERIKLEDGVHLHEQIKVELSTYAAQTGAALVKPFMLLIARDTSHASALSALINSADFFGGRYTDKVLQVDSSQAEELMIEKLLKIEDARTPTEIVIHVNMLKEGWDVNNLYTIVPLRAASARILIEQSIGRGLRLPYGKRTGVTAVDRLNIVAHDKFQEIIDEANKSGSIINLQQVVLENTVTRVALQTINAAPVLESLLGIGQPVAPTASSAPVFENPLEQRMAQEAFKVMQRLGAQSGAKAVTTSALLEPAVQEKIVLEVQQRLAPSQTSLEFAVPPETNLADVVAKTAALVVQRTISIPRILTFPVGEVAVEYQSFVLDCRQLPWVEPSEELVIQHLRTNTQERIGFRRGGIKEKRLEDYLIAALVDFSEVDYDSQADVLYELSSQVVQYFVAQQHAPEYIREILLVNQKTIARFMYQQMCQHQRVRQTQYETKISQGFVSLKPSAYTATATDSIMPLNHMPSSTAQIPKVIYGQFERCLYLACKFQSNGERILASILERESLKWFKPTRGQFEIRYRLEHEQHEYQPDFVAELEGRIVMLEVKATNELSDSVVLEKARVARIWCEHASSHAMQHASKLWTYHLISHDLIGSNISLERLLTLESGKPT